MSSLKKLFGGSDKTSGESAGQETIEHEGFSITATPIKEGGQFRICGVISKQIDGTVKKHQLIRADLFPNEAECSQATLRKARQVIKEQGDALFR